VKAVKSVEYYSLQYPSIFRSVWVRWWWKG